MYTSVLIGSLIAAVGSAPVIEGGSSLPNGFVARGPHANDAINEAGPSPTSMHVCISQALRLSRSIEDKNSTVDLTEVSADCSCAVARRLRPLALQKKNMDANKVLHGLQMKNKCFDLALQSGGHAGDAIASMVVQSFGQVVINKAVQSSWSVLLDRMKDGARCDESPERIENRRVLRRMDATCRVLSSARIQELVSSPSILLDAAAVDILKIAQDALPQELSEVSMGTMHVDKFISRLFASARYGLPLGELLRREMERLTRQQLQSSTCPTEPPAAVMWVVGNCVMESQQTRSLQCSIDTWLDACAGTMTRPFEETALGMLAALGDRSERKTASLVNSYFDYALATVDLAEASAKGKSIAQLEKVRAFLQSAKLLVNGFASADWISIGTGASGLLLQASEKLTGCAKAHTIDPKIFRIFAGIGAYSASLKDSETSGNEARVRILQSLVESLNSRSEREPSARPIVGLGGSFGALGGVRMNPEGEAVGAFQPALNLGLGIDWLTTDKTPVLGPVGVHLELGVLDLGNYVRYEPTATDLFTLDSPEIAQAVNLRLIAGIWSFNREVPIFLGATGAVSPFVRDDKGNPTYQLGLVLGAWVPLLDLN